MSRTNTNLFSALRAAFPADLDAVAIETDNGLQYSWRDLERATAMLANLLQRAYDYASSAEHREGIAAFLEKRPPRF